MREVPLSRGLVALVDETDYEAICAVGKWYAAPAKRTFYARKNFQVSPGKWVTVLMHTFLTGWQQVDHANGNGLDNQRANLRPATTVQNCRNRGRRSDNRSGYKGVTWHKVTHKWAATINSNGKQRWLGLFTNPIEAAAAYDAAAVEMFGPFARLNFPVEDQ